MQNSCFLFIIGFDAGILRMMICLWVMQKSQTQMIIIIVLTLKNCEFDHRSSHLHPDWLCQTFLNFRFRNVGFLRYLVANFLTMYENISSWESVMPCLGLPLCIY